MLTHLYAVAKTKKANLSNSFFHPVWDKQIVLFCILLTTIKCYIYCKKKSVLWMFCNSLIKNRMFIRISTHTIQHSIKYLFQYNKFISHQKSKEKNTFILPRESSNQQRISLPPQLNQVIQFYFWYYDFWKASNKYSTNFTYYYTRCNN